MDVDQAVSEALKEAGVEVYSGFLLAQWNDSNEVPDVVTCASFTSNTKPLKLSCSVCNVLHI